MQKALLALAAIIVGAAVLQLANGVLGVLVPLRLGIERYPAAVIGIVVTAHSAGFLAGCLAVPRLVRGVGHIRAFAALAAALSATALAFIIAVDPVLWTALRLITGFCTAGLFTVVESWIADQAPAALRGRIIGVYMVCNKIGLVVGQLFLAAGDATGWTFFITASASASLALIPVALTRAAGPTLPTPTRFGLRQLHRIAPIGVVGCVGSGLVNSAVIGLTPAYGVEVGLPTAAIGVLMALMQLGSLLVQWPLGWLSDRYDRRSAIAAAAGITAAASLAIAATGSSDVLLLYLLFALWGGFALSIYAICIAHASDFAERGQMVPLVSGLLLAWATGSAIGPTLATLVMTWLGAAGLFIYAAAVALGVGAFAIWRMTRRPPVPADKREPFVNLPATSPTVAELAAGEGGGRGAGSTSGKSPG